MPRGRGPAPEYDPAALLDERARSLRRYAGAPGVLLAYQRAGRPGRGCGRRFGAHPDRASADRKRSRPLLLLLPALPARGREPHGPGRSLSRPAGGLAVDAEPWAHDLGRAAGGREPQLAIGLPCVERSSELRAVPYGGRYRLGGRRVPQNGDTDS